MRRRRGERERGGGGVKERWKLNVCRGIKQNERERQINGERSRKREREGEER